MYAGSYAQSFATSFEEWSARERALPPPACRIGVCPWVGIRDKQAFVRKKEKRGNHLRFVTF
jgi:hypothetical protein